MNILGWFLVGVGIGIIALVIIKLAIEHRVYRK